MVQDVHGRGAREMLRIQEVDVKKGEGFKYLQSGVQSNRVSKRGEEVCAAGENRWRKVSAGIKRRCRRWW